MSWTREQRNVTIAAYLGWTLDAFDFFLMVFVLKDIAAEFATTIPAVAFALYAGIARFVFDGRPLLIDELVQLALERHSRRRRNTQR